MSYDKDFVDTYIDKDGVSRQVDVCEYSMFYLLGYVFSIFTLQVTITTVSAFG